MNYAHLSGMHAVAKVAATAVTKSQELGRFAGRGVSQRTIETLIEAGYIFPEHLLFAGLPELRAVKGIGRKALAEIAAYRRRFLPEHRGPHSAPPREK